MGIFKPNIRSLEARKDIKGLIKALNYRADWKEWEVPYDAIEALGRLGDKRAVEPLIRVLQTNNIEGTCKRAAEALGKIGDVSAVEALNKFLSSPPFSSAWHEAEYAAAEAVLNITGTSIKSLQHSNRFVREKAAERLEKFGKWGLLQTPTAAVEPLISMLDSCGAQEHVAALLSEIGDRRAIEPLIRSLENKNKYVSYIVKALGKLGDGQAVEPILRYSQRLRRNASYEDFDNEKSIIVEALVAIGNKTIESLLQALRDRNYEGWAYAFICNAFAKIGDKKAIQPLVEVLKTNWCFQPEGDEIAKALYALGWRPTNDTDKVYYRIATNRCPSLNQLRSDVAIDVLIGTLEKFLMVEKKNIRDSEAMNKDLIDDIIEILGDTRSERGIESLIKILREYKCSSCSASSSTSKRVSYYTGSYIDPMHGGVAAKALAKIGAAALEPLIELLRDKNNSSRIRSNAAYALGGVGDSKACGILNLAIEDDDSEVRNAARQALSELKAQGS